MVTKEETDEIWAKYDALDSSCKDVVLALQIRGPLRHNRLIHALKQLDIKMSRPTLDSHLKHLLESGLVECKEAFQSSEYSLTKGIYELIRPATHEEIKKQLDLDLKNQKLLPKRLREYRLSARKRREIFERYSDEQIDEMAKKDMEYLVVSSLLELREFTVYDLSLKKCEDDTAFWKLIGNPFYRMHEKSIVENCRDCPRYKERLFSRIEQLYEEFNEKYNKVMPKGGIR
jgi:DNA-binding transcriptional ArsR family regulator